MHIVANDGVAKQKFNLEVAFDKDTGITVCDVTHTFTDKKLLCRLLRDFVERNDQ